MKLEQKQEYFHKAVVMSFNSISAFGYSKHSSRIEYNLNLRIEAIENGMAIEDVDKLPWHQSPYIHSFETFNQYVLISFQFTDWLCETHPDACKLKYAFDKGYAREFIQRMIDLQYAPSTINRATSALAKLYRCQAKDIHDDRPIRAFKDFTRSRNYSEQQYIKDVKKYGIIAELCRMTGVREVELENLFPECFILRANGEYYLHVDGSNQNSKGGKTRDVVILKKHQIRLREIIAALKPGVAICPVAPSHLDIHGIRSLYATDYYLSIARDITDIPKSERIKMKHPKIDNSRPNQKRTTSPGIYTRRHDGKKFDRSALLVVSVSLGHNREDVVVASYLR